MISCEFKEVLEFNTYILNCGEKTFELMLELYGVDKPQLGDNIIIHEELLDVNSKYYTQPYAFEVKNSLDLKKVKEENNKEFIILQINNKNYVLKRIYG